MNTRTLSEIPENLIEMNIKTTVKEIPVILKNKKSIAFIIIVMFLYWFWNSYTASTFELAKVIKVSENEITVVNLGNRVRTIKIPIDISKLIETDKDYIISYDKKTWDKWRLKSISPAYSSTTK